MYAIRSYYGALATMVIRNGNRNIPGVGSCQVNQIRCGFGLCGASRAPCVVRKARTGIQRYHIAFADNIVRVAAGN